MNNKLDKKKELIKMFDKVSNNIKVYGIENIPFDGVNIFVSNHTCFLDVYLLAYVINKPCVNLVSATSLFGNNHDRKQKLNTLVYPFPIEIRAGEHYTDKCLGGAVDLLCNGINLIIFPQGVFDNSQTIYKARTGMARILFEALELTDLPVNIIPISLNISNINKDNILSSDIWGNFAATVTFLPKFDYNNYYKEYIKNETLEQRNIVLHNLMDDLMKKIANNLDKPFLDKYGELYFIDGFWFPDGKYVKFEDAQNENLYNQYSNQIECLVNKYKL